MGKYPEKGSIKNEYIFYESFIGRWSIGFYKTYVRQIPNTNNITAVYRQQTDNPFPAYFVSFISIYLFRGLYTLHIVSAILYKGKNFPADTWRLYNVASTSMQRHDVASMLRRRCIDVMCPLGFVCFHVQKLFLKKDLL